MPVIECAVLTERRNRRQLARALFTTLCYDMYEGTLVPMIGHPSDRTNLQALETWIAANPDRAPLADFASWRRFFLDTMFPFFDD